MSISPLSLLMADRHGLLLFAGGADSRILTIEYYVQTPKTTTGKVQFGAEQKSAVLTAVVVSPVRFLLQESRQISCTGPTQAGPTNPTVSQRASGLADDSGRLVFMEMTTIRTHGSS